MIKNSYGVVKINNDGNIYFDNIDLKEIVNKYESPFFLMSGRQIYNNYGEFSKAFSGIKNFEIYYSVKTNFESEVLKTLKNLGCGAEISGGQDFLAAKRAGFTPGKIIFDGPYKTDEEIKNAIDEKIYCLNIESIQEASEIEQIARQKNIKVNVGMRIDPLVDKNYYDVIIDTYKRKFGFPIDKAAAAAKKINEYSRLDLTAIHMHIGSQITNPAMYVKAINKAFELIAVLKKENIDIKELNIGGGYPAQSIRTIRLSRRLKLAQIIEKIGIKLEKKIPSIFDFGEEITNAYNKNSEQYGIYPKIMTEPGRSIVSDIAVIIGKVKVVKENWAFVDFGVNDLAENMFFAERDFGIPGKMNQPPIQKINISGPTLSTADVIYLNAEVPKLSPNDPFVIFDTGAYSIARSTQFTQPRKAAYFITKDGQVKLIRSRETYEDVLKNQIW